MATLGTRAVRVDTRAMCLSTYWELAARQRSFGARTIPLIRSPKGRAARFCSEVAGVRPKAVGVFAEGQGRKVLFGGVGVRPNSGCRDRRSLRELRSV